MTCISRAHNVSKSAAFEEIYSHVSRVLRYFQNQNVCSLNFDVAMTVCMPDKTLFCVKCMRPSPRASYSSIPMEPQIAICRSLPECQSSTYLHDKFPASGHPPLRKQQILRLFLLLGLLDLGQAADRVHALAIVRSRLEDEVTRNGKRER